MDCKIRISLVCESTGDETDGVAEFYGSFAYRAEGQSSWTTIAQASDSSPWTLKARYTSGADWAASSIIVADRTISGIPSSAKFIEVQASLKEYDPTIFDADEDLGTKTISVPIVSVPSQREEGVQGNSSTGQARWFVSLLAL